MPTMGGVADAPLRARMRGEDAVRADRVRPLGMPPMCKEVIMELMEAINARRSCRTYTDEPVAEDDIVKILKAANAAPVAMHDWDAVALSVITDRTVIDRVDALMGAGSGRMGNGPTYRAPAFVIVSAEADEVGTGTAYCNAACIIENMMLAATGLGLGSGYILGVVRGLQKHPELFAALGIPDGFLPVSAMTLGHPAQPIEEREPTTANIRTTFVG